MLDKLNTFEQVLIYSDSTAMPRNQFVSAAETWPILLSDSSSSKIPLYFRGHGGIKAKEILDLVENDFWYFDTQKRDGYFRKTLVILSFGIVDAAILPFTYRLKFIASLPKFGGYLWRMLSKTLWAKRPILQRIKSFPVTSQADFERILRSALTKFESVNAEIIVMTTPLPSNAVEKRSPGFRKSVSQINALKRRVCKEFQSVQVVELEGLPEEIYISLDDGHHFSSKGHATLARILLSKLGGNSH
jgi:hypothetical protein